MKIEPQLRIVCTKAYEKNTCKSFVTVLIQCSACKFEKEIYIWNIQIFVAK